ncbi:DEAD/DEAH box helicase [Naegleria gruberi]|uniref:DEAD/DEAH box helicase n=1 Tax=Naegleria gruberi TaxID=5762 RepID=D2VC22_NAEGR|nr:DEAD/DEAH box helicase [Naegleria gruberi]EFC45672.1 DEAD/DEAH box helicase [Naegleria gruberi]|eukprot:XP_002678416.1 DEAD/DEAH box helicase [Naegleria gruberi strain NEG-M]
MSTTTRKTFPSQQQQSSSHNVTSKNPPSTSSSTINSTNKPKRNFSFPYEKPYDIQQQYMEQLFDTIQSGKVGIFESPTGSGKSLSLICGALSWLYAHYAERDGISNENNDQHQHHYVNSTCLKRKLNSDNDDEEPSWVTEQTLKRQKDEEELERKERLEKSKKNVQKYDERRQQFLADTILKESDDDLLLNEVDVLDKIGINNELLKDLYDEDDSDDERPIFSTSYGQKKAVEEDNFETPKIIYCSRTHSQLNQFVQELRKTEFSKKVRVSNIASRQVLCNNEDVLYRKTKNGNIQNSLNAINEKCQYLRDKKACSYDNDPSLFKDHMTVKVHDIEDLLDLGKRLKICSYFGTRKALPISELICMPYNSLIHEQTRKSLGISTLKDCVVIIDEAHNLINAIHQMHSVELDITQLYLVNETLNSYYTKFKNRLSSTNQTNINRLLTIINNMITYLNTVKKPSTLNIIADEGTGSNDIGGFIVSITDLVFETKLDNINLFDIAEFIEKSDLTKKLNMFMERQDSNNQTVTIHNNKTVKRNNYSANYVQYNATKPSIDVSKIITPATSNIAVNNFIKFLLLNPSVYFQSILKEARSVILTGGTMEPIQQLIQQVFPKTESSKIHIYQCDKHIVPQNHFLPIALSKGVDDIVLDFTFKNRQKNDALTKSLGKMIVNLCNIVPDGVVLFFPSYQYEKTVFEYWKNNGIIGQIEKKKKFLREASTNEEPNSSLEKILQEYKKIIDHNFGNSRYNGSVLSCVVGGKLSEGINFSDGYGRLIIVVGMPYPNTTDPELVEQQNFFEKTTKVSKGEYLDNLCMNGVNQSIGRAIRHSKDYATVLLLDKRYHQSRLTNKLSKWIRKGVQIQDSFGKSVNSIEQFFKEKSKYQSDIEKSRKDQWIKLTTTTLKK